MVERCPDKTEADGSIPSVPTGAHVIRGAVNSKTEVSPEADKLQFDFLPRAYPKFLSDPPAGGELGTVAAPIEASEPP